MVCGDLLTLKPKLTATMNKNLKKFPALPTLNVYDVAVVFPFFEGGWGIFFYELNSTKGVGHPKIMPITSRMIMICVIIGKLSLLELSLESLGMPYGI